jgi:hypothetical protein
MRLAGDKNLITGPHPFALLVTVLASEGLSAPGLVETVAKAIDARIDTYLVVPGPPGYTSGRKQLNPALVRAVERNDTNAIRGLLAEQYAEVHAKQSERRPVVLTASQSSGSTGEASRLT